MSWTAPRTWVAGEVVTAALMNTHVRDDLRYLKGLDGTITLSDGVNMGSNELTINSIEIVGTDGEVNKAAVEDHTHADGTNCGTIDHGATTGKGDDDHTIYALRTIMTTRGDIVFQDASGWARLAKGAAGTVLRMGASDPAWASSIATHEFFIPAFMGFSSGTMSFVGDFMAVKLDAATERWQVNFKCPHDFTSLTHCKIIGIGTKDGVCAFDWTVTTDFAAIGEVYTTNSDSDTEDAYNCDSDELAEVDISAAFTGLAADDYVGVKFVIDVIPDSIFYVIGLVFKYS